MKDYIGRFFRLVIKLTVEKPIYMVLEGLALIAIALHGHYYVKNSYYYVGRFMYFGILLSVVGIYLVFINFKYRDCEEDE